MFVCLILIFWEQNFAKINGEQLARLKNIFLIIIYFKVSVIKVSCAYRHTLPFYISISNSFPWKKPLLFKVYKQFFLLRLKNFICVKKTKWDKHILYQNAGSLLLILLIVSDLLEFTVNQSCPIYTPGQICLKYNLELHSRLQEYIHPHLKRIKCELSKAPSIYQHP